MDTIQHPHPPPVQLYLCHITSFWGFGVQLANKYRIQPENFYSKQNSSTASLHAVSCWKVIRLHKYLQGRLDTKENTNVKRCSGLPFKDDHIRIPTYLLIRGGKIIVTKPKSL